MTEVLARYHEIALKGGNRPFFVDKLVQNVKRACSDLGVVRVRAIQGRLSVAVPADVPWERVRERLEGVFGIANFSRVHESPRDLDALARAAARPSPARNCLISPAAICRSSVATSASAPTPVASWRACRNRSTLSVRN